MGRALHGAAMTHSEAAKVLEWTHCHGTVEGIATCKDLIAHVTSVATANGLKALDNYTVEAVQIALQTLLDAQQQQLAALADNLGVTEGGH